MTRQELLDAVGSLDREGQIKWMISLGMLLTISARDCYPFKDKVGKLESLMAFNEMQHQVYGRIRHLERGEEWTIESFFDALHERAASPEVKGSLRWAITTSLPKSE